LTDEGVAKAETAALEAPPLKVWLARLAAGLGEEKAAAATAAGAAITADGVASKAVLVTVKADVVVIAEKAGLVEGEDINEKEAAAAAG